MKKNKDRVEEERGMRWRWGKGAVFHGVVRKSNSKEATIETWMKGRRGSWDDLWEGCSRQREKQVQRP